MDGAAQAGPSLIKQLASSDNKIRNRALGVVLKSWLPSQSQISDEDMKKLWKGLFYCVWHSDKVPVQTQLVNRLASLLPDLHLAMSVRYFSVFLVTIRREWTGIDRLRLDKFYLLIRKFIHFFFLLLKKNSWDLELSTRFMSMLMDNTFLADDNLLGNGVNYHIASIFLEEVRPFLPLSNLVVDVLLGPFVSTMGKVQDKILMVKIKSNVFDKLLQMGNNLLKIKKSIVDVDSGVDDDAVVLGSIAGALGFSAKFYDLGSSVECPQGNRKVLLGLHEQFMKLEKDFASVGIDISLPEVNEETDEEVPTLVPMASEMEVDGSDNVDTSMNGKKSLKKSKKGKAKSSSGKKGKKNSISTSGSNTEGVNHAVLTDNGNANEENGITFNESVISNLQMQFEKVAAEVGLGDKDVESACDVPKVSVSKKRKRAKNIDNQQSANPELTSEVNVDDGVTAKSTDNKSAKKVRFSMKNNLVWKPHSPLPPQNVRIPPSVTPRGSALKQGIPPGPVREMPAATKRAKKKAKSLKKGRRAKLGIAPTVKRPRKLKTISI